MHLRGCATRTQNFPGLVPFSTVGWVTGTSGFREALVLKCGINGCKKQNIKWKKQLVWAWSSTVYHSEPVHIARRSVGLCVIAYRTIKSWYSNGSDSPHRCCRAVAYYILYLFGSGNKFVNSSLQRNISNASESQHLFGNPSVKVVYW